jgi:XTP/dITP diphosphohydrolase
MQAPVKLVVATGNHGKLIEITHLLSDLPLLVEGAPADLLHEIKEKTAVEGGTIEENARLKAEQVQRAVGGWVLADDSGLFVDALHGAPGVDSAHFGGYPALLEMLGVIPSAPRTAQFKCVCAVARGNGIATRFFSGVTPGVILDAPRGDLGFGYDPVFAPVYVENVALRSYAQMTLSEKAQTSHRARAAEAFKQWFRAEFA